MARTRARVAALPNGLEGDRAGGRRRPVGQPDLSMRQDRVVARDRRVEAFGERSPRYEAGWRGELHHRIADRTADIAVAAGPAPVRVLDVGCGTGYLLRRLADRFPQARELAGIDPAPGMIEVARGGSRGDERLRFSAGAAEQLQFTDGTFDLVVSTTSFDHWTDQCAGLAECARVLAPDGHLVLTDRFSLLLSPTLLLGHRGRARTVARASALLAAAGFRSMSWHDLSGVTVLAGALIRTVTATR
jgi:SAM-dependent methyltransferase